MAGADRQPPPALTPPAPASEAAAAFLAALRAEPWRFDWFQAIRVLEAAHPEQPPLGRGRRAAHEPVRLGQPPELSFPPAEILTFEQGRDGRPARLLGRVLGLFGPQGALPLGVTARARALARRESDRTFADFADVFHHRMLALYYRAWAEARPAVGEDRPEASRTRARLRALLGLCEPAGRASRPVPERYLLFVAGLLLPGSRPAEALERALALWLGLSAEVQEFRFQWLAIPQRLRARLGRGRLGRDSLLGARVADRASRFRVRLGPMSFSDYEALLPDRGLLSSVLALVVLFQGRALDFDLLLVLRREEVPAARLDGRARHGWTS